MAHINNIDLLVMIRRLEFRLDTKDEPINIILSRIYTELEEIKEKLRSIEDCKSNDWYIPKHEEERVDTLASELALKNYNLCCYEKKLKAVRLKLEQKKAACLCEAKYLEALLGRGRYIYKSDEILKLEQEYRNAKYDANEEANVYYIN